MKKYNQYLNFSKATFVLVLIFLLLELAGPFEGWWLFVAIAQFFMGLFQLVAGFSLLLSRRKRPTWFDDHIRYYWWVSIGYFVILYLVTQMRPADSWQFNVWLFGVPWIIALYQFIIVYQLRNALSTQKEEELWMMDQQKNLKNSFSDF